VALGCVLGLFLLAYFSGALPPFAEADPFILDQIRTVLAEGITSGGVSYEVQIISKDSQSNSNRASEVAAD
jgi:branched-chain amino acid transport system substrate-binding protein